MEVHGDLLLARILSAVASSIFRVRAVLLSRQTDGSRMDTKSRFCTKKSPGQVAPARKKKAPQATKTKGEKGENTNNRGNQKDWTTTTRGLDKQTALERKNRREQPGKTGATIQDARGENHTPTKKTKDKTHAKNSREKLDVFFLNFLASYLAPRRCSHWLLASAASAASFVSASFCFSAAIWRHRCSACAACCWRYRLGGLFATAVAQP